MYSMNHNIEIVDYREAEKFLNDDCQEMLKESLKKYKTTDFAPQDMTNIVEVLYFITTRPNVVEYVHNIKDDERNGFFQYALNKVDLPIVKWLIEKGNIKYHTNKECEDFLLFCIEQLSPDKEQYTQESAHAIVKCVIDRYKDNKIFQPYKEDFIKKMIVLQLRQRALSSQYKVDEELLTPFLAQDQTHTGNGLCNMYQTIVDDESGNTIAHIIINQRAADELHTFIKKNYVSDTVINKEKMTVRALAFQKFRAFTMNTVTIDIQKEDFKASRCCHYMLDKYFAEKDFDKKDNCCEKHVITKKYGASADSTQNKFQLFTNSGRLSKLLLDEPEQPYGCTRLFNCLASAVKSINLSS